MEYRNFFICLVDALRYDVLPEYRDQGVLDRLGVADKLDVPYIAQLANKGVTVPNLHSTYSSTPPAMTSLLTGLYPREHGVYDFFRPRDSNTKLLSEYLSDEGFYTVLFNGHVFTKHLGIKETFDEKINGSASNLVNRIKNLNERGERVFVYYHTFDVHPPYCLSKFPPSKDHHRDAVKLANSIAERIEDDRRFTLEDALRRSDGEDGTLRCTRDEPVWDFLYDHLHRHYESRNRISEEPLVTLASHYINGINLFDRGQLAEIVDFLFDDDYGEETLFLLTADHGESIVGDESELKGSSTFLHRGPPIEELIKIPGVFVNSGLKKDDLDRWSLTSIVDLMPTCLDELAIDFDRDSISGRSLGGEVPDRYYVFADHCKTERSTTDVENPEKENVFPLPAVLSWHTVISSNGYKYYRRGLDFNDADFEKPIEQFIRLAYAKILFMWPRDSVVADTIGKLKNPDAPETRRHFLEALSEKKHQAGAEWEPRLYNWRHDNFEENNLLEMGRDDFDEIASELESILTDRFPDPLHIEVDEDSQADHESEEDVEDVKQQLKGLGYL